MDYWYVQFAHACFTRAWLGFYGGGFKQPPQALSYAYPRQAPYG